MVRVRPDPVISLPIACLSTTVAVVVIVWDLYHTTYCWQYADLTRCYWLSHSMIPTKGYESTFTHSTLKEPQAYML
jgi:hypothetical protein